MSQLKLKMELKSPHFENADEAAAWVTYLLPAVVAKAIRKVGDQPHPRGSVVVLDDNNNSIGSITVTRSKGK